MEIHIFSDEPHLIVAPVRPFVPIAFFGAQQWFAVHCPGRMSDTWIKGNQPAINDRENRLDIAPFRTLNKLSWISKGAYRAKGKRTSMAEFIRQLRGNLKIFPRSLVGLCRRLKGCALYMTLVPVLGMDNCIWDLRI